MKKIFSFTTLFICATLYSFAQWPYMSAIPNGPNKKAIVTEQVGLTDVTISYHRPSVNGREGKIWGDLIHKGFINQGFGSNALSPWRAGANENTIIEFNNDVKIEGQPLPKGKYALFIAYGPAESIVIFSKKYDAWGSFFYDEKDDALRVKVKPLLLDKSVEWLRYEFTGQTENSAIIALEFEKLSIPFKVEVDYLQQQFDAISSVLKNPGGFTWQSLTRGAAWCLQNNYRLQQGLAWAKLSSDTNSFGGHQSFNAISTTAQLLAKLGKTAEAIIEMKRAVLAGNMNDLHQYAKQLLQQKKIKEATEIFELNYKKNPGQYISCAGMARGLSAKATYKKALGFAKAALLLAPDEANKEAMQAIIDKLKKGEDIN
jgi:tetratricopeptide (TPR) repeat protein